MARTLLPNNHRIALTLCALLLSVHALYAAPFVYVADTGNSSVSVIDAATNAAPNTIVIPGTNVQNGIAISPDGSIAYVPCYNGTATLQRIGTAANTLLSQITLGSATSTNFVAITPDGKFAYVTTGTDNHVLKVDLTTNMLVGPVTGTFSNPAQIVIAPDGRTAYVLNSGDGAAIPIDLSNNTAQAPIVSLTMATGLAVSPDSNYLYISDFTQTFIQQYNIAGSNNITPVLLNSIPNPYISTTFNPQALVITRNGNTLYVVNNSGIGNGIGTIDISTPLSPTPLSTHLYLSEAPFAMAITPDNKTLYATLNIANQTIAVDISSPLTLTLKNTISTPTGPAGLAIAIAPMNLLPPASVSGCKTRNVFLLQTDYINKITWSAPANSSPSSYNIYRDAALTELVATVPASGTLQYYDHNRNSNVIYTYYITAVDSSGDQSTPANVTVTRSC
jgi:YVTN family beta-propeller protein